MRNLKKFLALVLAMVMVFSLMLSASAASDTYGQYKDKDEITPEFQTAVQVLTGLDVLKGDENGFRPASTLTRAEAAVIVYRVATGDVKDAQTPLYADYNTKFQDVTPGDWFAGYVGYCQNAGIIKGTSPTTFSPYLPVTGYEMLAMLLRVVGYGKNNEFTGSSWQVNTAALAENLHITDTVGEANFKATLNKDARRDVVAELTFITMTKVPTVTFTPALNYSDTSTLLTDKKNDTIGYKIFRLVEKPILKADPWGRPNDTWFTDSKGNDNHVWNSGDATVAAITWKADVTETVAKTECDLVHENTTWSKDKDVAVSSRYLNGVKNTAEKLTPMGASSDNTIEALGTTNVIGAQGRLLEIYDMSKGDQNAAGAESGSRIVEIDTFLARVDKVTAAGTDQNGHPTPATIDLSVYPGNGIGDTERRHAVGAHNAWDFDGVKAEGYAVGEYVLVYVNRETNGAAISTSALLNKADAISNIEKADIKAGGYVNLWTNGNLDQPHTTTLGTTKYNDSDKFCLNWRDTTRPWSVAMDRYENAIGLVSPSQYLAIEGIRWIHDGTLYGGYALADVVLSDGTKAEGVKIADVNNRTISNTTDNYGSVQSSTVSDYFLNNRQYYKHIFTYAVKEDGTYSLKAVLCTNPTGIIDNVFTNRPWGDDPAGNGSVSDCAHYDTYTPNTDQIRELETAIVTQGEATIQSSTAGHINNFVATSSTVFAVLDANNQTYTVYVGKEKVPSFRNATVCAHVDAQGYADFVLIKDYTLSSNRFVGYLTNMNPVDTKYAGGALVYGYEVYKVGETTASKVYSSDQLANTNVGPNAINKAQTGFYLFTVNNSGVVTSIADVTNGGSGVPVANGVVSENASWTTYGVESATWTDSDGYALSRTKVVAAPNATSVETQNYNNASSAVMVAPVSAATAANYEIANGYAWTQTNNASANMDFNVADAKIMVIEKAVVSTTNTFNTTSSRVYAGTMADVNTDSLVWVYYKDRTLNGQTIHDADMVYVLKVPFDTSNRDKTEKVITDSALWVGSNNNAATAEVAKSLRGYRATAWGTPADALKDAYNDPYMVKLSDATGAVTGVTSGYSFGIQRMQNLLKADATVDSAESGAVLTGIKIYSGEAVFPTTQATANAEVTATVINDVYTSNTYGGVSGSHTLMNKVPTIGDRILVVQTLANGNIIYTVIQFY